jgi:hypothetical protein
MLATGPTQFYGKILRDGYSVTATSGVQAHEQRKEQVTCFKVASTLDRKGGTVNY